VIFLFQVILDEENGSNGGTSDMEKLLSAQWASQLFLKMSIEGNVPEMYICDGADLNECRMRIGFRLRIAGEAMQSVMWLGKECEVFDTNV
jgi:hypothetical protein